MEMLPPAPCDDDDDDQSVTSAAFGIADGGDVQVLGRDVEQNRAAVEGAIQRREW